MAVNDFGVSDDPRVEELCEAVREGDVKAVKRLLIAQVDANAMPAEGCDTPVWLAIAHRQIDVLRAMGEAGVDLNEGFPDTPLTLAARLNHREMIATLVAGGADVHRPNNSGFTPLLMAVTEDKLDSIAELLRLGADPNRAAKKKGYDHITNYTPMEYAARAGKKKILVLLRAASGSTTDAAGPKRGKGKDKVAVLELCGASMAGDLKEVKRLVEQEKVDVNAKDDKHETPLIHAARQDESKVVRYLLDHGADVNLNGGRKSNEVSPLLAGCDSLEITKMLVEAGADLDYTMAAEPNFTALDFAKESRAKKVVEYLLGLQKQRGGGKAKKVASPRGVTTFDTNDAAILIAAPVAKVSAAFAKRVGAKKVRENVLGDVVKVAGRCYLAWKLNDSPWTVVQKVYCSDFRHWPSIADAVAISKSLKTRALYVGNSDTGGVTRYALFDRGEAVEVFDYGSIEAGDAKAAAEKIGKVLDVDLSTLPNVSVGGRKFFASSVRKVDVKKIKNDLDFVNDFVKTKDAYVPFGLDAEWGEAGEDAELSIEGLGPDDIERLDYLAVSGSK